MNIKIFYRCSFFPSWSGKDLSAPLYCTYNVNICSHSISVVQSASQGFHKIISSMAITLQRSDTSFFPPPQHELICKLYLSRTGTVTRWEYFTARLAYFSSQESHVLRYCLVCRRHLWRHLSKMGGGETEFTRKLLFTNNTLR